MGIILCHYDTLLLKLIIWQKITLHLDTFSLVKLVFAQ
jgi:hypothetical protein